VVEKSSKLDCCKEYPIEEYEKFWHAGIGSQLLCLCSLQPQQEDWLTSHFERMSGDHTMRS